VKGSVILPRQVGWLTRADTPREEWLEARRQGVGGSEVSIILGSNRWTTAYELWCEKTGRLGTRDVGEAASWGTLLEDTVAREWARRSGATIRRAGMCADPVYPWRLASVDRVVVEPGTRRAVALLEVKTTSARAADLTDYDLVERYAVQVLWYLGVTGLPAANLAVLVGGQQLRMLMIPADPDWYHAAGEVVDEWWSLHVTGGTAPPVTAADNPTLNRTPAQPVEAVIADTWLEHQLDRLRELKHRMKADGDEAGWIEAQIKATLGPATELHAPDGTTLATWREQTATRLDGKKLKAALPDVWGQYTTTTTSRVLRLPKEDDE
jgi:putative phage-type endonuclease